MKIKLFFSFLVLTLSGFTQNIPSHRITDWSVAGAKYSFYDTTVNIMDFGGDSLGVNDNTLALTNAMASLPNGGAIWFPAGDFYFTSTQNIPEGIKIKGSGAASTKFNFDLGGSGHAFLVQGTVLSGYDTLQSGYTKDSKLIEVKDASTYSAGEFYRLTELHNGRMTSSWAYNALGQIIQIDSVLLGSNELRLTEPLRLTYTDTLYPQLRKLNLKQNVGFECFTIERMDSTASQTANISFTYAANCYVKGIESFYTNFSHIKIENATNINVHDSYFKNSHGYGGGGRGYGVTIQATSGSCLIENNQFEHLRHSVLLQSSANGNVIGYNYSKDAFWESGWLPANSAGDLVLHGNFTYLNLFEGNICQQMVIDNSHGINGPYNTFFRNRGENYGLFMNNGPASDSQNYVGNEITNPSLGFYLLEGVNHYEYGNNKLGTVIPTGTTNLTRASYYLTEKPLYWNYYYAWPSIGGANYYNTGSNPAQQSYMNGELSFCQSDSLYYNFLVCLGDSLNFNGKDYKSAGSFYDSVINTNGEKKYLFIDVQFTTKPTIAETWFLESSGGVDYQWYFNGQIILNDTNKIASITQNGYYQVEVVDSNGCKLISDSLHVTSAGIDELNKQLLIYPNPTQGEFIVKGDDIVGSTYVIRDVSGKIVLTNQIKNTVETINISRFKKGIYFIDVEGIIHPKRIVLN